MAIACTPAKTGVWFAPPPLQRGRGLRLPLCRLSSIQSLPLRRCTIWFTCVFILMIRTTFGWGYHPGYYGTVICTDGTVVYGTGYVYPAYVGTTVYVSYPVTYGYACNPCWTPWVGWSFGFAVGWAMASDYYWWCWCPPAPYWGPYWIHVMARTIMPMAESPLGVDLVGPALPVTYTTKMVPGPA